FRHAVGIVLRLDVPADAASEKYVEDFADAIDVTAGLAQLVEQHAGGRRHGVVVAVGGALEGAGHADEGSRDNAANLVGTAQDLPGDLSSRANIGYTNDLLVRRHQEDAVGGSVNNRRSGSHMPRAQLL